MTAIVNVLNGFLATQGAAYETFKSKPIRLFLLPLELDLIHDPGTHLPCVLPDENELFLLDVVQMRTRLVHHDIFFRMKEPLIIIETCFSNW